MATDPTQAVLAGTNWRLWGLELPCGWVQRRPEELPGATGPDQPFTRAQSYHPIRKFLATTADNSLRRVAKISRSIGPSHINSRIALLCLRAGLVPQTGGCDSREHLPSGLEVIELEAQGLLVNLCGNPSIRQLNWELAAISYRTRTDS